MEEKSSHCIYCQNLPKPSHQPPSVFWYILRANPLTSSNAKSMEFSRLPLLRSCFPAESLSILGNCGVDHVLYKQTEGARPHRASPFPSFLCDVLQPTRCYFCPPGILIPPQISPHFSREKPASALHKFTKAVNSQLASLGSAGPSPDPRVGAILQVMGVQSSGFAGRHWESCLVASRTGTIDPGPVLALHFASHFASPALLHVFLLVLFFTDTWQQKNNPAPHRHFNNSYPSSVTASLINKYLLEYNHFFLKQEVFRNEITIITSKNMYEQQTFSPPVSVVSFICMKAFPIVPLVFLLAETLLLIELNIQLGSNPNLYVKKLYIATSSSWNPLKLTRRI